MTRPLFGIPLRDPAQLRPGTILVGATNGIRYKIDSYVGGQVTLIVLDNPYDNRHPRPTTRTEVTYAAGILLDDVEEEVDSAFRQLRRDDPTAELPPERWYTEVVLPAQPGRTMAGWLTWA